MLMLMQMPGQRQTVFCRGLSLFGALLALALLGMIVLAASTFFETLAAERRARIAVQQLTVLADASASHVHGRFPELLAAARGGPVEITLAQLKGAGSLPADFSAVDALGRGYRVLILAAGADAIDVLAAEADRARRYGAAVDCVVGDRRRCAPRPGPARYPVPAGRSHHRLRHQRLPGGFCRRPGCGRPGGAAPLRPPGRLRRQAPAARCSRLPGRQPDGDRSRHGRQRHQQAPAGSLRKASR